ncbi:MAG TPA: hypothetical protein VFH94_08885, partial [Streptomyces sp.]|nr:hypothetical protein [Streptomyces sp.]
MKCGHEQPHSATELTALPAPPPPPGHAPAPTHPSAVGEFFSRAFRGRDNWLHAAQAAAWPVGLLLVMAMALAAPSYGQEDGGGGGGGGENGDGAVGWGGRLRIALALLLQALGGGFEVSGASQPQFDGSGSGSGGDSFGSGGDFAAAGGAELSLVPLTVTVLWIAALLLGVRLLRKKQSAQSAQSAQLTQPHHPTRTSRTAGLEAALRITLLVTAAVLILGLFAQPEIDGVEVSSAPLLAALGTLVLSLAVTAGVLQRDDLTQWLAQRPAAGAAVRALGTALRVFGAVVALCTLVGFVVYATADDVDGEALLLALPILPNIGMLVFGLSWGVPVEYDVRGAAGLMGGGGENGSFGLSELSDAQGAGAVAGVLVLGLVCALALGLWTARRSTDRREQLMASGFFVALFLLFVGLAGVSVEISGQVGGFGTAQGAMEVAPSVPYALLFGLLWVGGVTLLAPYLLKLSGASAARPTPPLHPAYTPPAGSPASTPSPSATPESATPNSTIPAPSSSSDNGTNPAGPPDHPDTVYVVPAPAPAFGPAPVQPPPQPDAQAQAAANAQALAQAQAAADAQAQAQARALAQAQAAANAQAQTYVPGLAPAPAP